MTREADPLVNGGCNYRGLGAGGGEDRGNDARITSNYPGDYLFMMNPVSRKMESSSGSGRNVMLDMCILHIPCRKSDISNIIKYQSVCMVSALLKDQCLCPTSRIENHY